MSLAEVRFDEASDAQFREFWEAQGWKITRVSVSGLTASRHTKSADILFVDNGDEAYIGLGNDGDIHACFWVGDMIATFGEALRYANNLAQAELFGGWAE